MHLRGCVAHTERERESSHNYRVALNNFNEIFFLSFKLITFLIAIFGGFYNSPRPLWYVEAFIWWIATCACIRKFLFLHVAMFTVMLHPFGPNRLLALALGALWLYSDVLQTIRIYRWFGVWCSWVTWDLNTDSDITHNKLNTICLLHYIVIRLLDSLNAIDGVEKYFDRLNVFFSLTYFFHTFSYMLNESEVKSCC